MSVMVSQVFSFLKLGIVVSTRLPILFTVSVRWLRRRRSSGGEYSLNQGTVWVKGFVKETGRGSDGAGQGRCGNRGPTALVWDCSPCAKAQRLSPILCTRESTCLPQGHVTDVLSPCYTEGSRLPGDGVQRRRHRATGKSFRARSDAHNLPRTSDFASLALSP